MKNKKSIYIALVILLAPSLACSAADTEPTTVIEPTISAATAIPAPSQEAVGIDGPPGPETIDLGNPALYIVPNAPAYKFDATIKITGVDTTGSPKEFLSFTSVEIQTQPQTTQHILFEGNGQIAGAAETVIIGNQLHTIIQGVPGCKTLPVSSFQGPSLLESTLESMPKIQENITGQALRVESGVEVNGFVTDKYELSKENLVLNQEVTSELTSAFVYVARDGGFITRIEQQGQAKIPFPGFDPNQFGDVTTTSNYILVEDGSLDIAVPAGCDN